MESKKKKLISAVFWILTVTTVFAAYSSPSSAYFYNITPICKDNICVRGETATWNVVMRNDGMSEVEYISIELVDLLNKNMFASLNRTFYPLSDYRGDPIVVRPNQKVTINISAPMPKANFGNELVYYPCFKTTITDQFIIARDNAYESRQCFTQNETMQVFDCITNEHCLADQFCRFTQCAKLKCGDCQYISNHTCMSYECCSNGQCGFDQKCTNNACMNLDCSLEEYAENHTCYGLDCAFDEFIFNKTCNKLDCGYDEFASNHTCNKLNCSEDELIEEHSCRKLQCKETEYAQNHECVPLRCLYNETISNHTCRPLDCLFFQDKVNHLCVNNRSVIIKLVLELLAVIVIIAFFVIDFRKFEGKEIKKDKEIDKK